VSNIVRTHLLADLVREGLGYDHGVCQPDKQMEVTPLPEISGDALTTQRSVAMDRMRRVRIRS
jgi:hypothetical protein